MSLSATGVHVHYGPKHALNNVSLAVPHHQVTALIGPSGCGKSTLLRCFNRMNDTVLGCQVTGSITLGDTEVNTPHFPVVVLRRRVGLVFQEPNPFPKSIFDNVAYGLRINGIRGRKELEPKIVDALQKSALWDEVKDRLDSSALALSGGQQQRLCIARALAVTPEVLLMDEPTSALDPIATTAIEELIQKLKKEVTIVIVTHNMEQARRIANQTAFFYLGELLESGPTEQIFETPRHPRTKGYVSGSFG